MKPSIDSQPVLAYIGVGANTGDPLLQCRLAMSEISLWPEALGFRASSFYQSEAKLSKNTGGLHPSYVNAVIEIKTALSPLEILNRLLSIEAKMGRHMGEKGRELPRPIDLDLLAYGQDRIVFPILQIPHPRAHERRFVLEPWAELSPEWQHPFFLKTIQDLLAEVYDDTEVRRLCGC